MKIYRISEFSDGIGKTVKFCATPSSVIKYLAHEGNVTDEHERITDKNELAENICDSFVVKVKDDGYENELIGCEFEPSVRFYIIHVFDVYE